MKITVQALFLVFVCVISADYQNINAQGFKGIVPTVSDCEDVRRNLGGSGCGKSSEKINLPNETVIISYITKKCQQFTGDRTRWNLPVGTVFIVVRKFDKPLELEKLGIKINEAEYTSQTNDIGEITYIKKSGEMHIQTFDGYVSTIFYYPSDRDELSKACKTQKRKAKKKSIK